MSRVSIIKNDDGTISVNRKLCETSSGGVTVRLMKKGECKKGVMVKITQSEDGKRFSGEIIESDE